MSKKIFLLPAILLTSTSIANADGLFDGVYLKGSVGSSVLDHQIERNIGLDVLPVQDVSGVTSANDNGVSFGGAIGYSYDITDRYFVAAEGFFNFETANTRNINSVLITDIDLDNTYGGKLLAGTYVTDEFSVYAHSGVTFLNFDVNNSYTFDSPVRTASRTETAFSYGIGADFKVTDHFSIFTEFTMINDVNFEPIGEVAGETGRINPNDLDLSTLNVGLKYSF